VAGSTFEASPSITANWPGKASASSASAGRQRLSISIAVTLAPARSSAGEAAGAGADFEDIGARKLAGNGRDAVEQLFVEQEILAERLGREQPVAGDDLAQRGSSGRESRARSCRQCWRGAGRIRRPGEGRDHRAGPREALPAMSKAVPWSGEVRMIGRPSVTLTPSSKSSAFIGISA
jgi:hypothetical protein